jgi:hypothetical protein
VKGKLNLKEEELAQCTEPKTVEEPQIETQPTQAEPKKAEPTQASLSTLRLLSFWQAIHKLVVPLTDNLNLSKLPHGNQMLQDLRLLNSNRLRQVFNSQRTATPHFLHYEIPLSIAFLRLLDLLHVNLRLLGQSFPLLGKLTHIEAVYKNDCQYSVF